MKKSIFLKRAFLFLLIFALVAGTSIIGFTMKANAAAIIVTADSVFEDCWPGYAVDRDGGTKWWASSKPTWIKFDYGSAQNITGYTVKGSCKDFYLAYSNDNVNWTNTDGASDNYEDEISVTLSAPISARYLKLVITAPSITINPWVYEFSITPSFSVNYTVTYDGNGNTGGSAPDATTHQNNSTVTVAGNTGSLAKTGYTFAGWNTLANGSGTNYTAGSGQFTITDNVTLYAKWTPGTYTVTYDTDGGTVSPASQTKLFGATYGKASNGTTDEAMPTPTRTGYTFGGWYTEASGAGTQITDASTVSTGSNHTLYAKWTINTYTVTYNGNGNTGGSTPGNTSHDYNTTVTVAENTGTLVKTGYTFGGWNTLANGSGTNYTAGSGQFTITDNITIYAKWTPGTYTVTYDADGGTVSPASQTKQYGATYGKASDGTTDEAMPTPTRTGYTFGSWYTEASGAGTQITNASTVSTGSNHTLYAKWTPGTYTVTYDADGGTVSPASQTKQYGATYGKASNGTTDEAMPTPTRTGYTFGGWYTEASGAGTQITDASTVSTGSNHTLYAKWTINTYTVTYNGNGNTGGSVPASSDHNYNTQVTVAENTGTLVKTGYTFGGWNTLANGSGTNYTAGSGQFTITDNITIYAKWTPGTYTVTYDADGGSVSPASQTKQYGATYGKASDGTTDEAMPTPTRTGYTFGGWYTEASGAGTQITDASTVSTGSNHTLYAKWTINTYTVTYNGNGNTGGSVPSNTSHDYNTTVTVAENTGSLAKTGYTFAGWNTLENGSGTNYTAGSGQFTITDNITVYAKWTGSTYTVTYDAENGTVGTASQTKRFASTYGKAPDGTDAVMPTPTRTGYTFAGWYDGDNGTGSQVTDASVVAIAANHTLYAKWAANTYTVTYDAEGGTVGTVSQTKRFASTYGKAPDGADAVMPIPTWTGYTFAGWYDGDNGTGSQVTDASAVATAANHTLYAKWTANTYMVTYDAEGGTVDPASQTKNFASTYGKAADGTDAVMPTPTKSGYDFAGWYDGDDGTGNQVKNETTITTAADHTLFAKWNQQSSDDTANIQVNGKTESAGSITTSSEGGRTVTTITVNSYSLEQKLAVEGNNSTVTIPVNTQSDVVVGQLTGQMVKNMENRQAVVEVKTNEAAYTLPAQQIKIDDVSKQFGTQVELKDIKVQIEVAKPTAQKVTVVENSAKAGEFTIVAPPVEFNVTCTYDNKTVSVTSFNSYVERTIAIPAGVDPSKITTGILVEPDGTVRHVPTRIILLDGKYYAKINSLTNSAYSVIWHPMEFKDTEKHWAKEAINDMGSRMIIGGVGNDMFEPDRAITRAEFAVIVVRALGLKPVTGSNSFMDVSDTAWYRDYVTTAVEYKIVTGYGIGKFGPNDKITREQAMAMIARAMKITGLKAEFADGEIDKLLAGFRDGAKSADYARNSIAVCIKTGVFSGRNGNLIAPKDNITRAETAAVVQRLLQKSNLI